MPITTSAKKALRTSARKELHNVHLKDAIHRATKKIRLAVKNKKPEDAKLALREAYKALDKATKEKFIKKNTASRSKSRLSAFIKRNA
ncbi:MAG: 30S ribosomal protein S20 [bacterium]|nr:30S ribosomal protein S20 [bacterium]